MSIFTPPDDPEARMRRALGLRGSSPTSPDSSPQTSVPNGQHPNRRRFVRDGEVPVTVIHRDHHQDDGHAGNQLEAARQSLREQEEARERAERLLTEAQNVIRDLQTKLAHERLSKDEVLQAVQRAEADRESVQQALQAARDELEPQHAARQKVEDAPAEALESRQTAERKLGEMMAAHQHEEPSQAPTRQIDGEPHTAAPGLVRK